MPLQSHASAIHRPKWHSVTILRSDLPHWSAPNTVITDRRAWGQDVIRQSGADRRQVHGRVLPHVLRQQRPRGVHPHLGVCVAGRERKSAAVNDMKSDGWVLSWLSLLLGFPFVPHVPRQQRLRGVHPHLGVWMGPQPSAFLLCSLVSSYNKSHSPLSFLLPFLPLSSTHSLKIHEDNL